MLIIQYLIIIIAALLIGKTLVKFQNNKLDLKQAIIWVIVWIVLLIVALLPQIMGVPAAILGINRGIDVFVYLGIVILFYVCFMLYNKLENLRSKVTKLIRIIAIQQAETEALIMERANRKVKKTIAKPKKKSKAKPKKKAKK
jgi:hypothetical protein